MRVHPVLAMPALHDVTHATENSLVHIYLCSGHWFLEKSAIPLPKKHDTEVKILIWPFTTQNGK